MSLDRLVSDDEFLKNVLIGTIDTTVKSVRDFIAYKQQSKCLDEAYTDAESFLSIYRACAWKGRASVEFTHAFKKYMVAALIQRWGSKKVAPYLFLGISSFGSIMYGAVRESPTALILGALGGICSILGAYLTSRQVNKNIDAIHEAIDKKPDLLDKALKYLYANKVA